VALPEDKRIRLDLLDCFRFAFIGSSSPNISPVRSVRILFRH
ncbi:unnamed protein product, partial [Arabidopsis halleri]